MSAWWSYPAQTKNEVLPISHEAASSLVRELLRPYGPLTALLREALKSDGELRAQLREMLTERGETRRDA